MTISLPRSWLRPPLGAGLAILTFLSLSACAVEGPEVWDRPVGASPSEPALTVQSFENRDGFSLPLRNYLPKGLEAKAPKAVILALHGFNDYSFAFEDAGTYLAKHGVATYAYDQRSFGAGPHRGIWPGSEALMDDLADALALLAARYPGRPLYVLGESMGGAVALGAASRYDLPVKGLILSAPAVWARRTMPFYQRWALAIAVRLFSGMNVTGKGLKIQASDNIEMLIALGKDPLFIKKTRIDSIQGLVDLMSQGLDSGAQLEIPALLLYGAKDEVIPWEPTAQLWSDLPDRGGSQKAAYYEAGWHLLLRDLQARVVLDDILAWIEDPSAPLPSGADIAARQKLAEELAEDAEPEADVPSAEAVPEGV